MHFSPIELTFTCSLSCCKLYIIPDAELDGFEREGGGRGVETYVYIHEQNENIIHKILTSFCWFVLSFIWRGGDSKGVLPT